METPGGADHRIEPEFLGPLGERPLAESAGRSTPGDLFPGASKFLSARQQTKRHEQWNAVRPMVEASPERRTSTFCMSPTRSRSRPSCTASASPFVYAYHQVILVVTDQRIIEALLNFRAKGPGTRLRFLSLPAPERAQAALRQADGGARTGTQAGLENQARRRQEAPGAPSGAPAAAVAHRGRRSSEPSPLWHCPRCGAGVRPEPEDCASCRSRFRSTRVATMLVARLPGGRGSSTSDIRSWRRPISSVRRCCSPSGSR